MSETEGVKQTTLPYHAAYTIWLKIGKECGRNCSTTDLFMEKRKKHAQ